MTCFHRSALLALCLLAAPAIAAPTGESSPAPSIIKAVSDPTRPAEDRALDGVRRPAAVLAFAGVKPGMAVAEYLPGGGYYTRLLSDAVGPKGRVFALETTRWGQENIDTTKKAVESAPLHNVTMALSPLGAFTLPQAVDVFWITDNYHDLHVPKYANVDIAAFNRAVFAALKPGGTYLILDHAAAPGSGTTASPTLHRIDRKALIDEVTAAGFVLDGESDLLANPADDHSKAIFEPALHFRTDQFLLRFRRP